MLLCIKTANFVMWQRMCCVSVKCSALRRELQLTPQRRTLNKSVLSDYNIT